TSVIINEGGGRFTVRALPTEAQLSPVYGIAIGDFDGDGAMDILAAGNSDYSKPEVGSYLAGYGVFLKGDNKLNFKALKSKTTGLHIRGQVRDMALISRPKGGRLIISRNNDYAKEYDYQK
ncbi:MAG TPA: VCBS repeat-containing protein, partial [Cyclobacteriaceae bacterium]|nr:VCBS repeat-containing protein [Cyclobacteriaceae bacterium]